MVNAAIITVKKLLTPAPAYGPRYEAFSRPGHATMRWQFIGQRGTSGTLDGQAFFSDADAATAWLRGVQSQRGSVVVLRGELNAREVVGFLEDAYLRTDRACRSTAPDVGWELVVAFVLTPTEPY